ncbi:MAG: cofactor-independent phosphoglycerate mutase [Kiritimatiellae bacterium]|jgi:2,3-bisphosphoglycerate-independent phosphoglycerate mutase|nr:cofactor-independent phosphoglycerate mutase [Kiritimatiellia bacterium]
MKKTVIFIGDGMADEPIESLGGKTPLQYAETPAMDYIARKGVNGSLLTLPADFPTSSDVANMSILGCDLATEYCGRGALEAFGRGIDTDPDDIVYRVNLVTVDEAGNLSDFAGGRPNDEECAEYIKVLNDKVGSELVKFYAGVSYRNILVLKGGKFSTAVKTDKPDDNPGNPVAEHLPKATAAEGEETALLLRDIISKASDALQNCDLIMKKIAEGGKFANSIWPWSGGSLKGLKTPKEKYGVTGAVISAVDVIIGLGRALGLDTIAVEGATGYIDTNYEGKAAATIEALKSHDFVYCHVEGTDEVSHEQNLELKIQAIQELDQRLIQIVIDAFPEGELNMALLPDHPVPIRIGKHTRVPVPVAVVKAGVKADSVQVFDEEQCLKGRLGLMKQDDLMRLLFPRE